MEEMSKYKPLKECHIFFINYHIFVPNLLKLRMAVNKGLTKYNYIY